MTHSLVAVQFFFLLYSDIYIYIGIAIATGVIAYNNDIDLGAH
jgi:hypothetical protein